jgi:hypothetical protein
MQLHFYEVTGSELNLSTASPLATLEAAPSGQLEDAMRGCFERLIRENPWLGRIIVIGTTDQPADWSVEANEVVPVGAQPQQRCLAQATRRLIAAKSWSN